jgi:putative flippase GtrA
VNRLRLILLDKQFYKFLTVGFSNFCISYSVFLSIMAISKNSIISLSLAQTLSYLTGMIWSFFWNKRWSFSNKSTSHVLQFAKFTASQLSLLILSVILVNIFVDWMHLGKYLGWVVAMSIITLINFLTLKVWVFVQNK